MFMLAWSRAFMLPCTFPFAFALVLAFALPVFAALAFEFAVFAVFAPAVLAVLAVLALPALFVLPAEEHPAASTPSASAAGKKIFLIPSLPYPTGVKFDSKHHKPRPCFC
jgi:hypothetical protein